jgi:hypothetical protein
VNTQSQALFLGIVATIAGVGWGERAVAQEPPAPSTVPQPAPPASPVPAPSPDEVRHRRVTVDIDSPRSATIVERRISVTESGGAYLFLPYRSTESVWEQVCVTPCSVDLDRFSTYRVGKLGGVIESRPFVLPQGTDRFQLRIEPGSAMGHRIGAATLGVGVTAFAVGAGLIAAQKTFRDETDARTAGFITGGAGLLLVAIGIPVTILTSTKVLGAGGRVALTPRGLVF